MVQGGRHGQCRSHENFPCDVGALPCADAGRLLPQGGGCQELKTVPLPECVLQVTRPCPVEALPKRSGATPGQRALMNTPRPARCWGGTRCRDPAEADQTRCFGVRHRAGSTTAGFCSSAHRKVNRVRSQGACWAASAFSLRTVRPRRSGALGPTGRRSGLRPCAAGSAWSPVRSGGPAGRLRVARHHGADCGHAWSAIAGRAGRSAPPGDRGRNGSPKKGGAPRPDVGGVGPAGVRAGGGGLRVERATCTRRTPS